MSYVILPISGIRSTPTPTPNKSPTPTPTPSISAPITTLTPTPSLSSTPIPSPTPTATTTPTPSPQTIAITQQPQSQSVDIETQTSTSFEIVTESNSQLLYSWQVSTDNGQSWQYITSGIASNNTSVLYIDNIQSEMNNNRYRCKVTNYVFTEVSNEALLTIISDINIQNQPLDTVVSTSGTASFSIGAL